MITVKIKPLARDCKELCPQYGKCNKTECHAKKGYINGKKVMLSAQQYNIMNYRERKFIYNELRVTKVNGAF